MSGERQRRSGKGVLACGRRGFSTLSRVVPVSLSNVVTSESLTWRRFESESHGEGPRLQPAWPVWERTGSLWLERVEPRRGQERWWELEQAGLRGTWGARGAFRAKDSVAQLAFGNDHSGACWRAETEARKGTTTHMRGHCGLDWGGTWRVVWCSLLLNVLWTEPHGLFS